MNFLAFVTQFGDLVVLLPLAAALTLWLLHLRSQKLVIYWCIALMACLGVTALLKLYFLSCALGDDELMRSPSGHTSLSILVYGAIGVILATHASGWWRLVALAPVLALVTAIAASRIALGAHNLFETGIGLLVGGSSLALFIAGYRRHQIPRFRWPYALLLLPLLALALTRQGFATEDYLRSLGHYLRESGSCFRALSR
jgi:membrane-associated phospholipid phosphatase